MTALLALVRKDLVLYFSNRRALLVSVLAPIMIAAFFGMLFGGNSKDREKTRIPIAIVDQDGSEVSKAIVKAMAGDDSFEVRPLDETAANDEVRRGKLRAVLTIPKGFGADAPRALFSSARGKPTIEIRYDPSQAIELQVVEGLLTQHVMEGVTRSTFSMGADTEVTSDAKSDIEKSTNLSDTSKKDLLAMLDSVERVRHDPALKDRPDAKGVTGGSFQLPYTVHETAAQSASESKYNPYTHAFVGMAVQFILFMAIDLGIRLLAARRTGIWQRLRAAPVSRATLLGSQVIGGAVIATVLFVLIFAAAIGIFGVRVEGSVIGFAGMIVAFALMTAGFGLFIAALGKTPEATRGLAIFVTLVMVMLGGAWVPAFIFPAWLQKASLVVPTRWAVDGLDAVTWRGLGFDAVALPIAVLVGFAVAFTVIATWRFGWDEK